MKFNRILVLGLIVIFNVIDVAVNAQNNSITSLNSYKSEPSVWLMYDNTELALYNQIAAYADELIEDRNLKVSKLKSKNDWIKYSNKLKESFSSSMHNFKKTPLNARVTGSVEQEDFIAEKIVFESQPGFYVTGCLFIPKKRQQEKLPAVIVPTGHSQQAFRRDIYQNSTLNLVKKGFIVFTFDPIGQGERVQYPDPETNQSYIGGSTFEHSYAGAQSLLTGNSISDYFIWDGVRVIDYLCSRPEVDSTRIGMTGVSGGGTQTAFVSAYDDRILAAAPECYITSYQRLFESIGPQDAEQNLYRGLARGIEHIDLLTMRASKPTMIIATTQDFFSIQGARETYAQAKNIFGKISSSDNIKMIEADGVHGSKKDNRQGMYKFFQTQLNLPGDATDLEVNHIREDELIVTSTGQVVTALNSKTVFDFNKENAIDALNEREIKTPEQLWQKQEVLKSKIQELSGYDATREIKSVVYTGKVEKEEYKIEKYFIQGKDFNYPIPFVVIKPYSSENRPLLLYLDSKGKDGLVNHEEEILEYLNLGFSVIAPDLLGTGELENKGFKGDSYLLDYSFNLFIGANLVGKSIAGMQASDLEVLFQALSSIKEIDHTNITAIVKDEICSSYLHFTAFNKSIKKTVLLNPLVSYFEVATTRNYKPEYLWTAVPGALNHYDLSFLQSMIAPQELVVVNPVTAKGEKLSSPVNDGNYTFVKNAFSSRNSESNFRLIESDTDIFPASILQKIF